MKKVILVSIIGIFCFLPLIGAAQYTLSQTFSTDEYQPYHMDVADDGKLWASQYGDPANSMGQGADSRVFLYQPNGTVVLSQQIASGSEWANTPGASGCATFGTKGYIAVDTGEEPSPPTLPEDAIQLNNCPMWNDDGTRASPSAFTLAYPITGGNRNIRLGDLDFDNLGHLFAAHKTEDGWSVFDKDTGAILSGCPLKGADWGTGETGSWFVNRGIAVNHDGTKVYRSYGSSGGGSGVQYWEGSISGNTASYSVVTDELWSSELLGNPDSVFIDDGQRLWAPISNKKVRVYDTYDNTFLMEYTFNEIAITDPIRGIALNSDSTVLYLHNDWNSNTSHVLKYTGTPPAAHATPTPPATPTPTPAGMTAAHSWTIYE